MHIQRSFTAKDTGTLYLVPTPIGNLEDMTFRSIRILKEEVAVIASEDTRNTQKLLNHFEIGTKQVSFHEHNSQERIPYLLELLENGKSIAQVSDAGMPSISDPGKDLVRAAIEADLPVVSLPGATAGVTALIASGISPQPFLFYGFLPRKSSEQKAVLAELAERKETLIFYESPYRLKKTVASMTEIFGGERRAVLCRELTKLYEEYMRGTLSELNDFFAEHSVKGECCLVIAGNDRPQQADSAYAELGVKAHVEHLMAEQGITSKEAIKQVAKLRALKKQTVYRAYHDLSEEY